MSGGHCLCLALSFLLALASPAGASESSTPARLAARALLLDVARAGDRIVAVGAFGNVVVSDDEGTTWTQVIVPARALLTGITFADEKHGWAVGHDGVILATSDGGRTWARQDNGKDLDTVFLDVLFLDARRGFAIGAYGRFLTTSDGGRTWTPGRASPEDMHLNRISRAGDRLLIVGEAGTLLASDDLGATWTRLESPYEGSLFGIVSLGADAPLVVCGLRGNILVSGDAGESWREAAGEVPALLMTGTRLGPEGPVVLAGQGGNFYLSRDGARSFTHWKPGDFGTGVAELLPTRDGRLLAVGEAGATRLDPP